MSKTEKTPNYTAAQENLIREAAEANGGTLNLAIAETLAANPAMNDADGNTRKARSIVAKISRMGLDYERKQNVTKDGRPVAKKADLVARIATLAGVNVARLDGMANSPKMALETLVSAWEAREAANG